MRRPGFARAPFSLNPREWVGWCTDHNKVARCATHRRATLHSSPSCLLSWYPAAGEIVPVLRLALSATRVRAGFTRLPGVDAMLVRAVRSRLRGRLIRVVALVAVAISVVLPQQMLGQQTAIPKTHVVKRGDTLWGIAKLYLGDPFLWPEIYRLNTDIIEDPHWIYPGETLKLPGETTKVIAAAPTPAPTPVAQPTAPP